MGETKRTLRVALGQLEPQQGALAANAALAAATVGEHRACDLVVFPELFLSGISREDYGELEVAEDGPELAAIAAAARESESSVVVGAPLSRRGGSVNAALAFGPDGELTGIYEKTHRWDGERRLIESGQGIEVTSVGALRAGLMICFDVEFPEVARVLTLHRPDVLITIAANMEPFGPDQALLARARAVENRLPHIYVNRTGSALGSDFVGESAVIDATGVVLARAGRESTVIEIELQLGAGPDPRVDYIPQRRPELYGPLTNQ